MPKMLDLVDKALDQRPFSIAPGIILTRRLTVLARRDNRDRAVFDNEFNERIAIIPPIRQHLLAQQVGRGRGIMAFTTCQSEVQRVAQPIHFDVNLGAEAAPTVPQRLRGLTAVFLTLLRHTGERARRCCQSSRSPGRDRPQNARTSAPRPRAHTNGKTVCRRWSISRSVRAVHATVRHCAASTTPLLQIGDSCFLDRHRPTSSLAKRRVSWSTARLVTCLYS